MTFHCRIGASLSGLIVGTAAALAAITPDQLAAAGPAATAPRALCAVAPSPDPFALDLVPTANANGAWGEVRLRFADSPFGVTVSGDGSHQYAASIATRGLRAGQGALVVWAATPELDQVTNLGTLDPDGGLTGTIAYPKFLVFVTLEPSGDVERWSGPILLRGISPSGRMHSMAGHGPFQGEPCANPGFRRGGPGFGGGR